MRGEAAHVEQHRERVLGRRRKRHPDAALGLQLADEAPALGRDERPGAGMGEALGDVDGRSLRPARLEFGDDLQDRPARQRVKRRETETPIRRQVAMQMLTVVRTFSRESSSSSERCCAAVEDELTMTQIVTVGEGAGRALIAVLRGRARGPPSSGSAASSPTCARPRPGASTSGREANGRAFLRFDYSGHGESERRLRGRDDFAAGSRTHSPSCGICGGAPHPRRLVDGRLDRASRRPRVSGEPARTTRPSGSS